MTGPEAEKSDKRKETDPTEVASYDRQAMVAEVLFFPGDPMGLFRQKADGGRERREGGGGGRGRRREGKRILHLCSQ